MPSAGFKVRWLTTRSRVSFYGDNEDDPFYEECDADGSSDDDQLSNIIRRSIRQSVISEREEKEVGVESFLQRRLELAFHTCGGNAALICDIIHNNDTWFKFSHTTPPEWGIEENPYEVYGTVCRMSLNLNPVGWYCMVLDKTPLPYTDSELSLPHICCVRIASLLAEEYYHGARWAYGDTFCKTLCKRRSDWVPETLWKVSSLNLPKPSSDQMKDTMEWMGWTGVLDI